MVKMMVEDISHLFSFFSLLISLFRLIFVLFFFFLFFFLNISEDWHKDMEEF